MRIKFVCDDRVGIAMDALQLIRSHQLNLQGIEVDPAGFMYIAIPDLPFENIQALMPEMRRIEGVHDVSIVDLMPAEAKQRELESLLRATGVAALRVERDGSIAQVNASAQKFLKLPDNIEGENIAKWMPALKLEAIEQTSRMLIAGYQAVVEPISVEGALSGWWIALEAAPFDEFSEPVHSELNSWCKLGLHDAMDAFESHYIRALLPMYQSTRALAGRMGVSHTAVANKLKRHGIEK